FSWDGPDAEGRKRGEQKGSKWYLVPPIGQLIGANLAMCWEICESGVTYVKIKLTWVKILPVQTISREVSVTPQRLYAGYLK
ncbi:MAG: hypothetical protein QME57_02850, partial [Patescibacteria group bacterium]|nr:hypothetical protein [Patescibacteria group bacterium]